MSLAFFHEKGPAMEIRMTGWMMAGLFVAALIMPAAGADPPHTVKAEASRIQENARRATAPSNSKAVIPPLTRMPRKNKNPGTFGDLPITPPGSDLEDCFNDPIPYTPIPQG